MGRALERLNGQLTDCREPERSTRLADLVCHLAHCYQSPGDSSRQPNFDEETRFYLECLHGYCVGQSEALFAIALTGFSERGMAAFFLCQLFEQARALPLWVEAKRPFAGYYTPPSLAYRMAREAIDVLDMLESSASPTRSRHHESGLILDPCCGSGALLIAAADLLSGTGIDPSKRLYGLDIDEYALAVCRACMRIVMTDGDTRPNQILLADALSHPLPSAAAVLLNPPWSRKQNLEQGEALSYKRFVELAWRSLEPEGVLVLLSPSGIYSDQSCTELRRIFLEKGHWLKLLGYVNEDLAFPVHPDLKYALAVVAKSSLEKRAARQIELAFGCKGLSAPAPLTALSVDCIAAISPYSLTVCELEASDLMLHEKLYNSNEPLYRLHAGSEPQKLRGAHMIEVKAARRADRSLLPLAAKPLSMRFHRQFDMTVDRAHFLGVEQARERGFLQDRYGRFLKGPWKPFVTSEANEAIAVKAGLLQSADLKYVIDLNDDSVHCSQVEVYVPLLEGRHLDHYDFAAAAFCGGAGRSALWRSVSDGKQIAPQFLVAQSLFERRLVAPVRLGYPAIGATSNRRSMKAAFLPAFALGNAVPAMVFEGGDCIGQMEGALLLQSVCNSFVFDYLLRTRLGGNNINYYILDECAVPGNIWGQLTDSMSRDRATLLDLSAALSLNHIALSAAKESLLLCRPMPLLRQLWAGQREDAAGFVRNQGFGPAEQCLARACAEVLVARQYGLNGSELQMILRRFERSEQLPALLPLPQLTQAVAQIYDSLDWQDAADLIKQVSVVLNAPAQCRNIFAGRADESEVCDDEAERWMALEAHRANLQSFPSCLI